MTEANNEGARAGIPVARRRPAHHWTLVCAALLAFGFAVERSAAGHREHEDRDIWFVHATDPHLFIQPGKVGREEQQRQNQEAFSDLFKWIGSLPDGYGSPAFLVLTGDLGIDPCDIRQAGAQPGTPTPAPTPTARRNAEPVPEADEATRQETLSVDDCLKVKQDQHDSQIKITARILGESPVQDIYLIAGNNDIATESAGDPALGYFNGFIQDVQKELIKNKSSVRLHNLTQCYVSGEASGSCYADIPHSAYRLIGFPSYSFRSSEEKAQRAQFEKFRQLLEDSRKQGKKALVISHTPEMDDPFALAQQRYVNSKATTAALSVPTPTPAGPTATPAPAETATPAETPTPRGTATPAPKTKKTQLNKSFSVATWNVSEQLLDDWQDAINSESLVGVFAGHLHDSHKEIYRRPYAWSSGSPAAFRKLFLAPPLAVKNQVTSPIQARGFSLVHLQPDRIESQLFWYASETRVFTPDSDPKSRCERCHFWKGFCQRTHAAIGWLWNLDKANQENPLVRMAVLLIAFLTAFLTVVAIWQIPPASDPFAEKRTAQDASKPAPAASNAAGDSLPFSNRFGKTVIAGLAGLVAAEVTKTLGNEKPSPDSRWYYIVWFILFFFFLLLSLNLWRAVVEALRARVAVVYYPLAPVGPNRRTFRYWLVSLRVPLLTFSDTFINLIQGKNQTITGVFAERIIDQQRMVKTVADKIRSNLNELLERRVIEMRKIAEAESAPAAVRGTKNLVRVNISVLSADQSRVFYISRADGSSLSSFPKKSVAWISVFTGEIRWFKYAYKDPDEVYKKIVLFDNVIPGEKGSILLHEYYQPREREDYRAFVIFPVPWPRRGFGGDHVKGAIQISFSDDVDFDLIWKSEATGEKGKPPNYAKSERMLEAWCDEQVREVLLNSISVLGALLRGFNEEIYQNYIEDKPAS